LGLMSDVGEVKPKSIITWRFVIIICAISAISAILAQTFNIFTPPWAQNAQAISVNVPFVVMFLAVLVGNLIPRRVSMKHIAIISAVAQLSIYHFMQNSVTSIYDNFIAARTAPAPYKELIDWVWGPELQYIQQMLNGGIHDVPWRVWLPSLCWWMLFGFLWFLFYSSFLSIVRRRWIDIELLPYPASYQWTIPIIAAAPERRAKGLAPERRFNFFLVGLGIGFFYMWPPVLRFLVPWFPDIYGWSGANYIQWWLGAVNVPATPLGKKIVAFLALPTNMVQYATAMLIPLDILLSIWVTALTVMGLCQVAYLKGYYSGILSVGDMHDRREMLGTMAPFKLYAVFLGMGVSIIIFWLLLNWRYMVDTIRAAIKGPTREEWENEALPYRVAWTIFAASIIALILMYYSAGATVTGALAILLTFFLIHMSGARIYGLSLSGGPADWMYLPSITMYVFPNVTSVEQVTAAYANTMLLTNRPTECMACATNVALWFKVAKDVGVRPRDMYIAMTLAMAVASVIVWPYVLKLYYEIGISGSVRGILQNWWIPRFMDPVTWQTIPGVRPWWPHALAGAILVGILSYLRVRFIWWPFDPVGVYIGVNNATPNPWPYFVGWVVKYLVVKFGGMRVHDEVLIPLVAGVSIGSALCWFIGGVAALPKYIGG